MPPTQAVSPHLRLILDAANTVDVEAGTDGWGTQAQLVLWLSVHAGIAASARVTPKEHAAAIGFRDALRQLITNGQAPAFDAAAAPFGLRLTARRGVPDLTPIDEGPSGGVATIIAAIARAAAEGTWGRVKICPGDECLVAFYDESRNRSRTWCSMRVCGNRTKTRVYRTRHQPA